MSAGQTPSSPESLDLRGLKCPLPVMRARRRIKSMAPGTQIWLETTDPLAVIDIPAFCAAEDHRLVETMAVAGGHRFLVEIGAGS